MREHLTRLAKKEARLLISALCDEELMVVVFRGSRVETVEILHELVDVLNMPELGEVRYCGFIGSGEAKKLIDFLRSQGVCKYIVEARDWQKSFMENFCYEYLHFKKRLIVIGNQSNVDKHEH